MPADEMDDDTAGASERDPADDQNTTEGDHGNGAAGREPDEKPETDIDADLLAAVDEGMKAAAGESEEPADEADDQTDAGDESTEDASEESDEEKTEDEGKEPKAEDDPNALTETERKALSKKANEKFDRLLKERTTLKKASEFAEEVRTIAETGKMDRATVDGWLKTGARINTAPPAAASLELAHIAVNALVGPERSKGLTAPQRAAELRKIADRIAPAAKAAPAAPAAPQFLFMPKDLAELVATEQLPEADARDLALQRWQKANPPAPPKAADPPPAAEEEEQAPASKAAQDAPPWTQETYEKGKAESLKVWQELAKKHGPAFSKEVRDELLGRLKARSASTRPEGYADLLRDQAAIVLAQRQFRPRKPAQSITGPPRSGGSGKDPVIKGSWDAAIENAV